MTFWQPLQQLRRLIFGTQSKTFSKADVRQAIQGAIKANIEDLIPIYDGNDFADAEVTEFELAGEIEILDFTVVAASDDDVSLMMDVRTPLRIYIDYEDRSSATYDKEDDVYFGAETSQAEFEDDPTICVL